MHCGPVHQKAQRGEFESKGRKGKNSPQDTHGTGIIGVQGRKGVGELERANPGASNFVGCVKEFGLLRATESH